MTSIRTTVLYLFTYYTTIRRMRHFVFFGVLFLYTGQIYTLTCFHCQGIKHPRFCELVTECSANQICGIERELRSNGDVTFNTGCMTPRLCDSGVSNVNVHGDQTCIECCSSDLCNMNGCGERAVTSNNGTVCYACSGQLAQDDCHVVSFCEHFETCYIEEKTHFGEIFYQSGCKVKHVCDSQYYSNLIIGRRNILQRRSTTHFTCCDQSLCNNIDHIRGRSHQTQPTLHHTQPTPTPTQSTPTPTQPRLTPTQPTPTPTQLTTRLSPTSSTTVATTKSAVIPTECADIDSDKDGVYTIIPKGGVKEVSVFCLMRGQNNKWTVIQRRIDGTVDFYKSWVDYKNGFGSTSGEYWLGNDNIHLITSNGDHELSVYLEDFKGHHSYANYTHFLVGDEAAKYMLTVNGYTGVAGDGLKIANGSSFSTKDRDNDITTGGCARERHAAWWFYRCDYANLNGLYNDNTGSGPYWWYWHSNTDPLKKDIMMIKRK